MPRRKKQTTETTPVETTGTATAVAEPAPESSGIPAWIDGPPTTAEGRPVNGDEQPAEDRKWGNPYKALFTARDFEMGEDRRFKQRVFKFREKPSEQVLAALKEHGFSYRANEKAWTIHANADTRRLSDELAREFAGQAQGMGR